ncbi:MAG: GDP-L-fucose synthase family protein [Flavobacteriales bacterium]
MNKTFIAGHNGMVGSALVRKLANKEELLLLDKSKLNLEDQSQVDYFFKTSRPSKVYLAAAKVGGIYANNIYRADFIYNNLQIQNNIIHACYKYGVEKLLFLGSSCIYPKFSEQPIKEESLLTGPLEYTNEPYAIAKIAGIKMCESYYKQYRCNFISVMPTNLYGPNDKFDLKNSHVLPALLRKFHDATINKNPSVEIWGTGKAKREFMHVDDMADACVHIMNNAEAKDIYESGISHINIGTGEDVSIAELAQIIAEIVDFKGDLIYNTSQPDGTPRKLLDVSRLKSLGFVHQTSLKEGVLSTYQWYLNQISQ